MDGVFDGLLLGMIDGAKLGIREGAIDETVLGP